MEETDAAIVEFLGTFESLSSGPPESLEELGDGVALFEALSELAPDYFEPSTIARQLGDNWALKSSNLRKLTRNLETYYHDSLEKTADFSVVDISAIAKKSDAENIRTLVELVLAAAVTCPDKGTYVQRMMSMEHGSSMKELLETSLGRLSDYDNEDSDGDENELVFDGRATDPSENDEKDDSDNDQQLFGADHHLTDAALDDARREIATLKSQASIHAQEHETAQAKLKALVEDLQDRLVSRQDELIQTEEELQKTTSELEETKTLLNTVQERTTELADDLDVANAKAAQLHKAEATLMAYKKKIESVGASTAKMTDLEEQSANYLRQIQSLEHESKKNATLQSKVQQLQDQVSSLERSQAKSESQSASSATELSSLKSQVQAAESAKKLYSQELAELRAQQEAGDGGASAPIVVSDDKTNQILAQLEEENQQLKAQLQSGTPSKSRSGAAASSSNIEAEVERLQQQIAVKEKENTKISSDKDKLEAYTKRTLAKFQDKYLVALQECKAKLKEKQDKIEILESRSQSERTAQKREERLLSSTIYELGLAIMQNRLKER